LFVLTAPETAPETPYFLPPAAIIFVRRDQTSSAASRK